MDSSQFQPLLDYLKHHQHWLAVAILLVSLIESLAIVGILVPGVVLIFLFATLAGSGLLSLEAALFSAAIGAILGDGLSFYLGRVFHERLHGFWPFRRFPGMLERGEVFFRRHGGKSVVIGRFIGPVRPVIPVVAGMFDMPTSRFFTYNILSALAWAPVYVIPGFLVGASISLDIKLPPHFYVVFFSVLGLLLLTFFTFFNVHWRLQSEGHLYRWVHRQIRRRAWTQRLWHKLSSPRSGHSEFPLPSLMLFISSLLLFIMLTVAVMETHIIWDWNQATHAFFQRLRNPLFDPFFVVTTLAGDAQAHYFLFALLVIFLAMRRNFAAAGYVAAAAIATGLSIELIKNGLAVVRPDAIQEPLGSFAYPSGHAGGAMVFWGVLATLAAQEAPPRRRWKIYSLMAIPPLLVGLSRLYLGVHWLSDVIGGFLWALTICALARICYSPFDREALRFGRTGLAILFSALTGLGLYTAWAYTGAVNMYSLKI